MSRKSSGSVESARSRSPSRQRNNERRPRHDSVVCKPLDTLSDITEFLKNPPAWSSLCTELKPHSEYAVTNMDIVRQNHPEKSYDIKLGHPEAFCHFGVDKDDVARHRRKDLPKTLVCHDMAGGYHDDSYIDGTGKYDAYSFYNWAVVDIFCYFSHHFITIPPLGWINVGHAHGVQVLGTVITEWDAGKCIWEELLSAEDKWKGFARDLVAIAKIHKFDGWLLNVENPISKPAVLVEFVQYLHSLMHSEMSSPCLMWYDSVTKTGDLAWQNCLNDTNMPFFLACDGIFTNYGWCEGDVVASRAAAAARYLDVFVGVDVWGRNFLGGGKFNTQEAVKIIYKHGLSMAIFAPAWTYEDMGDTLPELTPFRRFRLRELALWGSLWPFLHTKLPQLPLSTSFCTGQGIQRRLYGEVIGPVPWYNLRHQQYQPNAALGPHEYSLTPERIPCPKTPTDSHRTEDTTDRETIEDNCITLPPNMTVCVTESLEIEAPPTCGKEYKLNHLKDERACLVLWLRDSYLGGGCLQVNYPEKSGGESGTLIRLFHCDFTVKDTLIAVVVTKILLEDDQVFNVVLFVEEGGEEKKMVLVGASGGETGVGGALAVYPAAGRGFKDVQRYLLLNDPGFYVSVENSYGWKVRYYSVPLVGRVTSVNCLGGAPAPVLLGHIAFTERHESKD